MIEGEKDVLFKMFEYLRGGDIFTLEQRLIDA